MNKENKNELRDRLEKIIDIATTPDGFYMAHCIDQIMDLIEQEALFLDRLADLKSQREIDV